VTGSVAAGGQPAEDLASVRDATAYTADVFRAALARHGVRVTDPYAGSGATATDARPLASRDSMPLAKLLVPFLKLSNNEHAEIATDGERLVFFILFKNYLGGQHRYPGRQVHIGMFVGEERLLTPRSHRR
jgi:D-Ala-D-Ala carboxypeptidase 3 (S13) family